MTKRKPGDPAALLLDAIRRAGRINSIELHRQTGIKGNNQEAPLATEVAAGHIEVGIERAPSATGRHSVRVRYYEWIGPAAAVSPAPTSAVAVSPHARAMRRCLGCGDEFSSAHAGNRLCSRCTGAAARRHDAGPFDTPAVIRYR